jgi:hypothetical protein|tara:strand:- start:85 stop:543 length:459 start_codon:yes stop_codon:yes gene_type:complete
MEIEYRFALILKLDSVPTFDVPDGFDRIEQSHLTLIGGPALKQFKEELKPHVGGSWSTNETLCRPKFADDFSIATREEVPVDKGNPDLGVETRKTLFLPVVNQDEVRDFVNKICEEVGITNPEPDRFFHVSLANNHGGNPWKSVGDICESDV